MVRGGGVGVSEKIIKTTTMVSNRDGLKVAEVRERAF
jgi:hypothetical protein